jgi:hypothetical protein
VTVRERRVYARRYREMHLRMCVYLCTRIVMRSPLLLLLGDCGVPPVSDSLHARLDPVWGPFYETCDIFANHIAVGTLDNAISWLNKVVPGGVWLSVFRDPVRVPVWALMCRRTAMCTVDANELLLSVESLTRTHSYTHVSIHTHTLTRSLSLSLSSLSHFSYMHTYICAPACIYIYIHIYMYVCTHTMSFLAGLRGR